MTAKAVYYLSDQSKPGRGNTCETYDIPVLRARVSLKRLPFPGIVPGSHRRGEVTVDVPEVEGLGGAQGQPEGAIPVCCPPNSALIFDRRLLHAGTPNYDTTHERLLFIIGFGYRWLRARDGLYVEPAMARATCPVVKQLLGATSSSAGLFRPAAEDTPRARWLHEHGLEATPGGRGRAHIADSERFSRDGVMDPADPAICRRIADGDVGGHATFPRHPWRANQPVEPPAAPLVAGRSAGQKGGADELHGDNPHVQRAPTEEEILDRVELTPEQWLRNSITPEELASFREHGYLIVQTDDGTDVVSAEDAATLQSLMREQDSRTAFMFAAANNVSEEPAAVNLLSNAKVMTRASGLLCSTNICVHHARLIASSDHEDPSIRDLNREQAEGRLEQELCGWLDRDLEQRPTPLISVTALFALGDSANSPISVLPGSQKLHGTPTAADVEAAGGLTSLAVPHRGCVLLDRRLWRTPLDLRPCAQDCVEVGFAARWLRPADPMYVERALEWATCPVLRQMLNWHSSCAGYWSPNSDDQPLLVWLNHHGLPPGEKGAKLAPAWAYGDGTKGDDGHASVPRPGPTL